MDTRRILFPVCLLVLLLCAGPAFSQCGLWPGDSLTCDTVDLEFAKLPDAASGDNHTQLDLWAYNDANHVIAAAIGFTWDNPYMVLDSVVVWPVAAQVYDFMVRLYLLDQIDSTNAHRQFMFAGASKYGGGVLPDTARQRWASYYFTLSQWQETDSIVIDTLAFVPGVQYKFHSPHIGYRPHFTGSIVGYDTPCCVGTTGNVDNDPQDDIDVGDLTYLIAYLWQSGPAPACMSEANCDGDAQGIVDIDDYFALHDYLYDYPSPIAECP